MDVTQTNQVPGAANPEGGATTQNQTVNNPGSGQQADKTYTAEDLAKQVQEQTQKALAAEREKWEKDSEAKITAAVNAAREEAAKMATMTEDEKAKAEFEKQKAQIDAKAQELAMKELRMDAASALTEKKLPGEAIEFVVGKDAKSTSENIEKFAKIFNDAVQKAVEVRLKGTTPRDGSPGADTSKMTDEEYYKWLESQKK